MGYSNKANAKKQLTRFKNGIDFSSHRMKNRQRGRSSELIMISIDCFKHLAMMSGTEQGKVVRKYFLECERIAKSLTASKAQALLTDTELTELVKKRSILAQQVAATEQSLKALKHQQALLDVEESRLYVMR